MEKEVKAWACIASCLHTLIRDEKVQTLRVFKTLRICIFICSIALSACSDLPFAVVITPYRMVTTSPISLTPSSTPSPAAPSAMPEASASTPTVLSGATATRIYQPSPNKSKAVNLPNRDGKNCNYFLADLQGQNPVEMPIALEWYRYCEVEAQFSPDGKKLAFYDHSRENGYVLFLDNFKTVDLPEWLDFVSWSPDSRLLLATRYDLNTDSTYPFLLDVEKQEILPVFSNYPIQLQGNSSRMVFWLP